MAKAHTRQDKFNIYKKNCLDKWQKMRILALNSYKMINIEQITEKITTLPIAEVGFESHFIKVPKILTAYSFVLGFFKTISNGGECTLNMWAQNISLLGGSIFSKEALESRLGFSCVAFCEQLLGAAIEFGLKKGVSDCACSDNSLQLSWAMTFNRVFVEDSTCFSLPDLMFPIFGGSANQKAKYCIARVQLRINLISEKIHRIALKKYGENDKTFAGDIVDTLEPNDLIIRDLGYHDLNVFERIIEKGAYFISRWFPRTVLLDTQTFKRIDLGKMLPKLQKKGVELWEQNCLVGLEKKTRMRVIFIKLPIEVEQKRREDALKKEKSKSIKYSKEYLALLGWSIYITNVPSWMLPMLDIWKIYTFRWRIEIIFKAWKSHLKLVSVLNDKGFLNPCHLLIRLYLMMIWVTLCLVPAYNFFQGKIYKSEKRFVSLAKFADFFRNNCVELVNERNCKLARGTK